MMRLLILGGTTESGALARSLAGRQDIQPILSFAGRTRNPVEPPIPFRTGGFGGVEGLKTYLVEFGIDVVIDATHPFAAQMSRNAFSACRALSIPLAILTRPAWRKESGDNWTVVADMEAAARSLGERPRRVLLTIGALQLAVFAAARHHHYIVRSIERPDAIDVLPSQHLILARGPFSLDDEIALMRAERIEAVVTKNSGGTATEAKIIAARRLGIEVVMVERPATEDAERLGTVDAALAWIDSHRPPP